MLELNEGMFKAAWARSPKIRKSVRRCNALLGMLGSPEWLEHDRLRREEYLAEIALLAREYGPADMNARSWRLEEDD